jgi:hypothetical protein
MTIRIRCPACDQTHTYSGRGSRRCPTCSDVQRRERQAQRALAAVIRATKTPRNEKQRRKLVNVPTSNPPTRPRPIAPVAEPTPIAPPVFLWPAPPRRRPTKTTYCKDCGHIYHYVLPPRREPACPACRHRIDRAGRRTLAEMFEGSEALAGFPCFELLRDEDRREMLTPKPGECRRCFTPLNEERCIECEMDDAFVAMWPTSGPVTVRVLA